QSAADFKKSLLRLAESLDCPVAGQELRLMDQLHVKYCHVQRHFLHWRAFAKVRRKFRRAIIDNGNDDERRRLRDFVRSLIDANQRPNPRRRSRCGPLRPALAAYLAMGHLVRLYNCAAGCPARCRVLALAGAAVAAEVYASLRRRLTEFRPLTEPPARRPAGSASGPSRIDDTDVDEAAAEASALVTAPAEADEADNPVEESAGPAVPARRRKKRRGRPASARLLLTLLRRFFLRPQPPTATMTTPSKRKSSKKRKKKQKATGFSLRGGGRI
uniref:DUF4477 domain-containing protein n=1 Tax=Macrostomum lignano TaxID=282301 RepID=A0A1I8FG64_9PLAT